MVTFKCALHPSTSNRILSPAKLELQSKIFLDYAFVSIRLSNRKISNENGCRYYHILMIFESRITLKVCIVLFEWLLRCQLERFSGCVANDSDTATCRICQQNSNQALKKKQNHHQDANGNESACYAHPFISSHKQNRRT